MEALRNRKAGKQRNKPAKTQVTEINHIENLIKYGTLERQAGDGESVTEDSTEKMGVELQKGRTREKNGKRYFTINFQVDLVSMLLLVSGVVTRMYRLREPNNIVFDELHYGKYISLYMKNTFFFDSHPPLGKQLIALAGYLAGYDGKFKFDRIGTTYAESVPLFAFRFVPALCGSLIIPLSYHLMLELGLSQWTSILASLMLLLDNALLTQSRFVLMESILILFLLFGLLTLLKLRKLYSKPYCVQWWLWLALSAASFTCALCVKYTGFYSCCWALAILGMDFWRSLARPELSDRTLATRFAAQSLVLIAVPAVVYLGVFYTHLGMLYKAGPHDSVMTSAFQASLEGGLASITKGQPLAIAHGSQITLRHSHGRACWLHSHTHVYPIRYSDKRGSSHQQQVSCYSFKDVNNWWIVKRPDKNDLVVEQPIDAIKHGDVVQLLHGMTSRALNSHDVAAPMSPQCQEVSCYIDYNVSMPAQNLWKVEILNRDVNGDTWHTIQSLVRLIHVDSNQALKYSGHQLPDWGFHQHEVVADRVINQDDTIWNVEEHRYTKSEDQKDRERDMITAEMIPTTATRLSFWDKFFELQYKMIFTGTESVQSHMYSSEPLDWPLMKIGIAYWISSTSNAQIHLLGNIVIWYSATLSIVIYTCLLVFYLLRRLRNCYDLDAPSWEKFRSLGEIFLAGYLFHFLPYFFVERTLFLHHYLPALCFKILLLAGVIEHLYSVLGGMLKSPTTAYFYVMFMLAWTASAFHCFRKFSVLSYGTTELSAGDIVTLRHRDTWDFIVHKT